MVNFILWVFMGIYRTLWGSMEFYQKLSGFMGLLFEG